MTRPSLFLLLVFSPFLLSAQEFVVDDALTVTPAVTPGLVTHPVMAALDDEGLRAVVRTVNVYATSSSASTQITERRC